MSAAIEFKSVDIVFGKPEQRRVGATLRTPVQDAAGNWSTPKVGEVPAGPAIKIRRGQP